MLNKLSVTIKGTTPLLMNRFPLEPVEALKMKTKEEQAEVAAYREPATNELCFPGVNVQRALVGAATYLKGKGRASLKKVAAACLMVGPEHLLFGVKNYEIDARAVVVPATKGRVVRFRPRLDSWQLRFVVEYDDVLLRKSDVISIIELCGMRVGIGDFRPERGGWFGRFVHIKED